MPTTHRLVSRGDTGDDGSISVRRSDGSGSMWGAGDLILFGYIPLLVRLLSRTLREVLLRLATVLNVGTAWSTSMLLAREFLHEI